MTREEIEQELAKLPDEEVEIIYQIGRTFSLADEKTRQELLSIWERILVHNTVRRYLPYSDISELLARIKNALSIESMIDDEIK